MKRFKSPGLDLLDKRVLEVFISWGSGFVSSSLERVIHGILALWINASIQLWQKGRIQNLYLTRNKSEQ